MSTLALELRILEPEISDFVTNFDYRIFELRKVEHWSNGFKHVGCRVFLQNKLNKVTLTILAQYSGNI